MEMKMEQLLSMGFPNDLAAKALAVNGGDVAVAADWILNQTHKSPILTSNPSPRPSPTPPFQSKINRFFQFKPKPPKSPPPSTTPRRQETDSSPRKLQKLETAAPPPLPATKPPLPPTTIAKTPPFTFPTLAKKPPFPPITVARKPPLPPATVRRREKIFSASRKLQKYGPANSRRPLADRMRPRNMGEVVGQDHLLAKGSFIRLAMDSNRLPSIVLWGPPGTGKTTIARAIVNSTSNSSSSSSSSWWSSYRFVSLSAVNSGVKEVRDAVVEARKFNMRSINKKRTVLFIDEVHRFNKSQQDSFLPVIDDGSIIFIGATTENPSFHLTKPLLSRCRVLLLKPLSPQNVDALVRRAVADLDKGVSQSLPPVSPSPSAPSSSSSSPSSVRKRVVVDDDAIEFFSSNCDGDARVALNALEVSAITAAARSKDHPVEGCEVRVTLEDAKEAFQCKHVAYDKGGEEHYNLISALHKSMRGSNAKASVYWLVRMLEGGEEPLYIARRLVRFASEDVGLADPSATQLAMHCYQACQFVGMPDCNVNLTQCVAYLARAPKSVAVYKALGAAQKVIRDSVGQKEGVPAGPTKEVNTNEDGSSTKSFLPPGLQGYVFLELPPKPDDMAEKSNLS